MRSNNKISFTINRDIQFKIQCHFFFNERVQSFSDLKKYCVRLSAATIFLFHVKGCSLAAESSIKGAQAKM